MATYNAMLAPVAGASWAPNPATTCVPSMKNVPNTRDWAGLTISMPTWTTSLGANGAGKVLRPDAPQVVSFLKARPGFVGDIKRKRGAAG